MTFSHFDIQFYENKHITKFMRCVCSVYVWHSLSPWTDMSHKQSRAKSGSLRTPVFTVHWNLLDLWGKKKISSRVFKRHRGVTFCTLTLPQKKKNHFSFLVCSLIIGHCASVSCCLSVFTKIPPWSTFSDLTVSSNKHEGKNVARRNVYNQKRLTEPR